MKKPGWLLIILLFLWGCGNHSPNATDSNSLGNKPNNSDVQDSTNSISKTQGVGDTSGSRRFGAADTVTKQYKDTNGH